jgi:hypothetical protein
MASAVQLNINDMKPLQNYASSLWKSFEDTWEPGLLKDIVSAQRQLINICPIGHPARGQVCNDLATALAYFIHYSRNGHNSDLRDEVLMLNREALSLRPPGHPQRDASCVNLARDLNGLYERNRDLQTLEEAIIYAREALSLRPTGHSKRHASCTWLAANLRQRYERTRNEEDMSEAITMGRMALSCDFSRPADKAFAYASLAYNLTARYERELDSLILDEIISLHRQALTLRSEDDPLHAQSCIALSSALTRRWDSTRHTATLDEAVLYGFKALSLTNSYDSDRASCCSDVAYLLCAKATIANSGDEAASDIEMRIVLERESLQLRPEGHPYRVSSYKGLCLALIDSFKLRHISEHLDEAKALCELAMQSNPDDVFLPTIMAEICLKHGTAHFNIQKATECLRTALRLPTDQLQTMFFSCCQALDQLIDVNVIEAEMKDNRAGETEILDVLQMTVDLIPLISISVLGNRIRDEVLLAANRLGSQALSLSMCNPRNMSYIVVEVLERTRGFMWSQALNIEDPQLKELPPPMAEELEGLLHTMAKPSHLLPNTQAATIDLLYDRKARLASLLQTIRRLPGLERFMLGLSCAQIAEALGRHRVVILAATVDSCYALILDPQDSTPTTLELPLNPEDLRSLARAAMLRPGASRHRGAQETYAQPNRLALRKTPFAPTSSLNSRVETTWLKIVQPLFEFLGLKVSFWRDQISRPCLLLDSRLQDEAVQGYTGVPREISPFYLYMLQEFIQMRSSMLAVPTMLCHLTLQAYPRFDEQDKDLNMSIHKRQNCSSWLNPMLACTVYLSYITQGKKQSKWPRSRS